MLPTSSTQTLTRLPYYLSRGCHATVLAAPCATLALSTTAHSQLPISPFVASCSRISPCAIPPMAQITNLTLGKGRTPHIHHTGTSQSFHKPYYYLSRGCHATALAAPYAILVLSATAHSQVPNFPLLATCPCAVPFGITPWFDKIGRWLMMSWLLPMIG